MTTKHTDTQLVDLEFASTALLRALVELNIYQGTKAHKLAESRVLRFTGELNLAIAVFVNTTKASNQIDATDTLAGL